jgi:hypothetical protein
VNSSPNHQVHLSNTVLAKHLPGVIGGDPNRFQSPLVRFSDRTSPSQPSFTPSKNSRPNILPLPLTGVGSIPQLDGGLLIELPDVESGGVDGKKYMSDAAHAVSRGNRWGWLSWIRTVGF